MDVIETEFQSLRSSFRRVEDEGLGTRTAVIENELEAIKADVAVLPDLAQQIHEMRAGSRMARAIAAAVASVALPLGGWIWTSTVERLHAEIEDQQTLLERHLDAHDPSR